MAKMFKDDGKFVSLFAKKKLLASLIVLFLLLVSTVTVVALYSVHTGGYTMSISEDLQNAGVSMYQYAEDMDGDGDTSLDGPKLTGVHQLSMDHVMENYALNCTNEDDGMVKHGGLYKSNKGDYVGYTFFVKNGGNTICNIQSNLSVTRSSNNMDEAVRIWLFTSRGEFNTETKELDYSNGNLDTTGEIYQKKDGADHADYSKYYSRPFVDFETETTVKTTEYRDFAPQNFIKITIIMWIEGTDFDCNNKLLGLDEDQTQVGANDVIINGTLKISMAFTALD